MQFHCMKMRQSNEPRDRTYVKGYGFLSVTKNMGKNLSAKYGQKLLNSAKKATADAKKLLQKEQFTKQQKQLWT